MPPFTLSPRDVLDRDVYERLRPRYRELVASVRRERRVRLGESAVVLFENRETVLWQVHEVLRCEGASARVERVLADYDPIVPRPGELRATVMIDSADPRVARAIAGTLRVEGGLELRCGGSSSESSPTALPCGSDDPVWYLRWTPTPSWIERLSDRDVPVWIRPRWSSAAVLVPTDTRRQLVADLADASRSPSLFERTSSEIRLTNFDNRFQLSR
jgi:hypothetical protein